MTAYEMTEHAYHLIAGGWTGADEELFREEDAKQDRPLTPDDITGIFQEIRRIERENAPAEQSQVINRYGVSIDFDAAVNLMDDDTREAIHAIGNYDDDPQGFFNAYAASHQAKHGTPWELDKPHPVY